MKQENLFDPIPADKIALIPHDDLVEFFKAQQKVIETFQKEITRLQASSDELEQKRLSIEEQFVTLKNKYFGKSSEKAPSKEDQRKAQSKARKKNQKKKVLLPSLRYPNAPLVEREVELETMPKCKCCNHKMSDSGMTENSEYITVIPEQHWVIRLKRHIYRCGKCHGDMVTAPAPPRIKPGGSYSDEMIVDVALSKYCDLIPVERYSSIAGRAGLADLPPQSLIEQTHYLADFIEGAYDKSKAELMLEKVLNADETPHKMLEQNGNKSWYLWGFSSARTSYFEIHNTRSGDVASEILKDSNCEYLVSDVFSGYAKAVNDCNKQREEEKRTLIKNVYCNAHARRKFREAQAKFPEDSEYYIKIYGKIYRLEKIAKRWPDKKERIRRLMEPLFEEMKAKAMQEYGAYSSKSSLGKAMTYFLKNYKELTLFILVPELPIDNNMQESQLRNPVVGRKTWYGTHSKRGAKTAAILFTLVESCKLNKVNPREYFKKLVEDLHQSKKPYTPKDYADLQK